jgi:ATP-dependent DNA ligase
MLSSQENVIFSCPHILAQLSSLDPSLRKELDGELYSHRMSFQEIESRVKRTVNLHNDFEAVKLHIFDVPSDESQLLRTTWLLNAKDELEKQPHLKVVSSHMAWRLDTVVEFFESYQCDNYEGIIVRHLQAPYLRRRSTFMMKFKPKSFDTYTIKAMIMEVSEAGVGKDRLGSFIVEDSDGRQFKVAGSIPHDKKYELWANSQQVIGLPLTVGYQAHSDKGVPMFAVPISIPGWLNH